MQHAGKTAPGALLKTACAAQSTSYLSDPNAHHQLLYLARRELTAGVERQNALWPTLIRDSQHAGAPPSSYKSFTPLANTELTCLATILVWDNVLHLNLLDQISCFKLVVQPVSSCSECQPQFQTFVVVRGHPAVCSETVVREVC